MDLTRKETAALLSFAGLCAPTRAGLASIVERGLVKIEADELDGRKTKAYSLTPEGSALIPGLLAERGYL